MALGTNKNCNKQFSKNVIKKQMRVERGKTCISWTDWKWLNRE